MVKHLSQNVYLGNMCGNGSSNPDFSHNSSGPEFSPGDSPEQGSENATKHLIHLEPTANIIAEGLKQGVKDSPRAAILVTCPDNIERLVPEHIKDDVRNSQDEVLRK